MAEIIKDWFGIKYILGKEPDPNCELCKGKGFIRRWPEKSKKKGILRFCSCVETCEIYKEK